MGGHDAHFGIGAERPVAIAHAVADFELGHAGSDGVDQAGGFGADAGGHRVRVESGAHIGVDIVKADGGIAHAHLALSRLADGYLLPLQHLGAACLLELDCHGHAALLLTLGLAASIRREAAGQPVFGDKRLASRSKTAAG